jgi:hypothetical protein
MKLCFACGNSGSLSLWANHAASWGAKLKIFYEFEVTVI